MDEVLVVGLIGVLTVVVVIMKLMLINMQSNVQDLRQEVYRLQKEMRIYRRNE